MWPRGSGERNNGPRVLSRPRGRRRSHRRTNSTDYAGVTCVFAPRRTAFAQLRAGERIDVRISAEDRRTVTIVDPPVSVFWTPEPGKIAS